MVVYKIKVRLFNVKQPIGGVNKSSNYQPVGGFCPLGDGISFLNK
jgi:hypothetical protein